MSRGIFITLEGPEGSGKTTQGRLLVAWLRRRGYTVVWTREPGGTRLGERLRRALLDPDGRVVPLAELLVHEAIRAQHVEEVIRPALARGEAVVCDRFADSSLAYQGIARGVGRGVAARLNRLATQGLRPDLTLIVDVPVRAGLARVGKRGRRDRVERAGTAFHQAVRATYLKLAGREPARVKLVDGRGSKEEVWARVRRTVERRGW